MTAQKAASFSFQNLKAVDTSRGRKNPCAVQFSDPGPLLSVPFSPLTAKELFHSSDHGVLFLWLEVTPMPSWLTQFTCACMNSSSFYWSASISGHRNSFQRQSRRLWASSRSQTNHKRFFPPLRSLFFFLNAKHVQQLWIWETGQCPVQRETVTSTWKHYGACHHELVKPGTMNTFSH